MTARHNTSLAREDRETPAASLYAALQELKSRHSLWVGDVRLHRDDVFVTFEVPAPARDARFGFWLHALARQGLLVTLLSQNAELAGTLPLQVDDAQTLRVQAAPDTPRELVEEFAGRFDGVLEALALGRSDLLLRAWAGRAAPSRGPYLAPLDDFGIPDGTEEPALWHLSVEASPASLARLDDSLTAYDDEECAAVGRTLAKISMPVVCDLARWDLPGRWGVLREIRIPAGASAAQVEAALSSCPSTSALAVSVVESVPGEALAWLADRKYCDGEAAAAWLLESLATFVALSAGVARSAVRVERADAAMITSVMPPENVRLVHLVPGSDHIPQGLTDAVVVDLSSNPRLRVPTDWERRNLLFVSGAALTIDGAELNVEARRGSLTLRPAQIEALLWQLSPGAGDASRSFEALAVSRRLAVRSWSGCDGSLDAAHWRAFHSRRRAAPSALVGDDVVSAARRALDPWNVQTNAFDRIFDASHLAAGSRVVDPVSGESLSYGELRSGALEYAGRFERLGLEAGDVVAYCGGTGIPALTTLLACLTTGCVFAPLDPDNAMDNLRVMVAALAPRLILLDESAGRHVSSFDEPLEVERFLAIEAEPFESPRAVGRDAAAVVLFTSGSTGQPKPIEHTHGDFLNCSANYGRHVLALDTRDRLYTPSRISFAYGLNNVMLALQAGAGVVLAARLPAGQPVTQVIRQQGVTVFMAVPVIFKKLLAETQANFDTLRLCISAGENLPAKLCVEARSFFGVPVLDGIGSTEVLSTFISNRPGDFVPGATGRLVPGFEVRLLNESGDLCRVGEVGILWVRGNTLGRLRGRSQGLLNAQGWLNTQDMFFKDAAERFHHVGRSSSVIKINACWFSPDVLEATMRAHPAVQECAVCMVNDEHGLPRPKAFVVLRTEDDAPDESLWRELRGWSRERLGRDFYPHFFARVGTLPRTSSGKIMKAALVCAEKTNGVENQ